LALFLSVLIYSPSALAETEVSLSSKYYQFNAHDKKSIWKGIVAHSPKVSLEDNAQHRVVVGLTEWSLRYHYTFKVGLYRCEIKKHSVDVDIAIHLPYWENKWEASGSLQQSWDQYVRMVSDHEDIHKEYAIRTATRLDKSISELGVFKGCNALKQEVNAISQRHMQQNKADNSWFDAKEKIYQKNAIWF
jgi:predicted secreted Zn-dependent protease